LLRVISPGRRKRDSTPALSPAKQPNYSSIEAAGSRTKGLPLQPSPIVALKTCFLETLLTSDFYSQPVNGGRHEETKSDQEADVRSNGGASSAA
jgi:hypothetical protein